MKAKSKKKSFIFIEVLQNGAHLADCAYPIGHGGIIKITAKQNGALSIPFYPLADDVEIFQATRKGAKIVLNATWDGFVSKHGEFLTITYDNYDSVSYDLIDGDFGCINLKDLKILFRLGAQKVSLAPPRNKQYWGSILQLVFDDPRNIRFLAGSIGLTTLLFAIALAILFIRPDSTPRKIVDLKKEYLLPLLHPEHLKTLPEAMQASLDRSVPLACTIKYYSAIISMLLDYPNPDQGVLFPSSVNLYGRLHKISHDSIDNFLTRQEERQKEILSKENQGLIAVPAVVGETFTGSLLRLKDKISLLHKSFNKNLELKKDYIERVKKMEKEEASYDYEEYRKLNTSTNKGSEILSHIHVLEKNTNEGAMYVEFSTLGKEAAFVQSRIQEKSSEQVPLSSTTASPVGMGISDPNFSCLAPGNVDGFNHKIGMIVAGEFAPNRPEKVREPLIGEINRDLVEKVIHSNQFDLQLCYELALRRNQSLSGAMDVKWRLDSRGEISDLEIGGTTIHDRQMETCLLRKIASWKFPRPNRASVEINRHLSFSPAKG